MAENSKPVKHEWTLKHVKFKEVWHMLSALQPGWESLLWKTWDSLWWHADTHNTRDVQPLFFGPLSCSLTHLTTRTTSSPTRSYTKGLFPELGFLWGAGASLKLWNAPLRNKTSQWGGKRKKYIYNGNQTQSWSAQNGWQTHVISLYFQGMQYKYKGEWLSGVRCRRILGLGRGGRMYV